MSYPAKLFDGRLVTVIDTNGKRSMLIMPDGRKVTYPTDQLIPIDPQLMEEEIKTIIIPAIDRLEELRADMMKLKLVGAKIDDGTQMKYDILFDRLSKEAIKDLINKWGL